MPTRSLRHILHQINIFHSIGPSSKYIEKNDIYKPKKMTEERRNESSLSIRYYKGLWHRWYKLAYRNLSKQFHPDRNQWTSQNAKNFIHFNFIFIVKFTFNSRVCSSIMVSFNSIFLHFRKNKKARWIKNLESEIASIKIL